MRNKNFMRGFAATAVCLATLGSTAAAQANPLIGCYLINSAAATDFPAGINFANWADAKAALDANGVAGSVDFFLIDVTGSDFNVTTPWRTLVNAAGSWGGAACFTLDEWVGVSSTNRVTLKTIPGASSRVVVDGLNGGLLTVPIGVGVFYQGADHVVFEDMEFKNFGFDAFSVYGEVQMQPTTFNPAGNPVANSNIIRRCVVHHNGGCGVMVYGNSSRPANTLVENCVFYNNMKGSTDFFNQFGRFGHVTGRRNDLTTVRQCTFYQDIVMTTAGSTGTAVPTCMVGNNSNTGLAFAAVSGNVFHISDQFAATGGVGAAAITVASGFYRWTMQGTFNNLPTTSNFNVFFDNSNGGPGGGTFAVAPTAFGSGGIQSTYLTKATYTSSLGLEAASVVGNPLFTNAAAFDFTIAPTSPAVDAGLSGSVTIDIAGNPRTGTKPDAGAFEAPLPGLLAAFKADLGSGPCGPIETLVGPAALTVNFFDLSTNGGGPAITSWLWNFGDGNTSTSPFPTHTYVTPGVMTVSLTVGDGVTTNTFTAPNYVNVQPYVLKATSTAGDLVLTGVPAVGAPGSFAGYTLLSATTSFPVGTGFVLGIHWDALTQLSLIWPIGVGDPVHFLVGVPGAFPEVPFTLPAGTMWALGFPPGFSLDLVQLYLTPAGTYVLHTNVARLTV
jgi:PKD repeat protein